MKNILTIIFLVSSLVSFSQKESYNWHFGNRAGINFSSGQPLSIDTSAIDTYGGSASISDTAGNLLFYSDGEKVWNRNHEIMPNGSDLLGSNTAYQAALAVRVPEQLNLYYLFTIGTINPGCYYSIIDMEAENGLGNIVENRKNIFLPGSEFATMELMSTGHSNNKLVWIMLRNGNDDNGTMNAYLMDRNGIFPDPVKSPVLDGGIVGASGASKLSSNGKFYTLMSHGGSNQNQRTAQLYIFNNTSGTFTPVFLFDGCPDAVGGNYIGCEFSPNADFLYLSYFFSSGWPNTIHTNLIRQFDMSKIDNLNLFESSSLTINSSNPISNWWDLGVMQLGPDGKIYIVQPYENYLAVINEPSRAGVLCNFQRNGVLLNSGYCREGLPNFNQSYFMKFNWEGNCLGDSTKFSSWFLPVPDSIHWDFDDSGSGSNNFSNLLNPVHQFSGQGNYTVTANAFYPNGRIESYERDVLITPYPVFELGDDQSICQGEEALLSSGVMLAQCLWNTGAITSSITVSDPGDYWLRVENNNGCVFRDTISVSIFPEASLDESALILSPTTCGNATGAIRGLQLSGGAPPFEIRWLDNDDNILSTDLEITNLAVGNYHLWVSDANGCDVKLAQYAINNLDSDLIILDAAATNTRCNQPNGSIAITVQPGLSDLLLYSIDNGNTWVDNLGVFTDMLPGPYNVRVKDSEDCEAVFVSNPLIIENLPGVEVTNTSFTPETGNEGDGTITITATGDSLYYSLNGNAPVPEGTFYNLSQGTYTIVIADKYGCDTTFQVEIISISGQTLRAVAGDTIVCEGFRVSEPLMVSNFNGIASFELTLEYNSTLLNAESYTNAHPEIQQGLLPVVFPGLGLIKISWTGTAPLSLPDSTILLDLVLKSELSGVSDIQWLTDNDETWFKDANGNLVDVYPQTGLVKINPPPLVNAMFQLSVCEGEEILQLALPSGGTGNNSVSWETPTGSASGNLFPVDSATAIHAGWYKVKVVDELNCMSSDSVKLTVYPKPTANFPSSNDTIYYEKEYQLQATPGYASYQWSTGDTTYFINITEDGEYNVTLQTAEGCTNLEKVMLVDTWFPFNIPNAFTPNGDGLNDTFRPVTDYDRFSKYNMVIYNSWGQRIYETSNPAEGWEGKDAATGVYVWVINYADYLGKGFTLRGSVTVIK